MRLFLRLLAVTALAWGFFAISPYLALYDLARAIETRDTALIAQRVNFRALRVSIAKELAEGHLISTDADGRITPAERQLALGAVATLGGQLLTELVTPQGLIDLLRSGPGSETSGIGASPLGSGSWSDIFTLVARSQTRGFRNVYFILPPRAPSDQRFRLQLRLSRFEWKAVGLELPHELRRRLARELSTPPPAGTPPPR